MGRKVIINGTEVYDTDVYSKVNVEGLNLPAVSGKGDLFLLGEADGGAPGLIEVTDPSEVEAKLYGGDLANACAIAYKKGVDGKIPGGATKIICGKTNQSTQSTGALSSIDLKTGYGLHTTFTAVECLADTDDLSGYARFINAYYNDGKTDIQVLSTSLGNLRPLKLEYSGAESTATVAVTETKLILIVGAVTTDFLFADYPTMNQLVAAINNLLVVGLAVSTPNPHGASNPVTILDRFTAVNIKTAGGYSLKIGAYECITWLQNESKYLLFSTRKAGASGDTIPDAKAKFNMTGGTKGGSANTNFQSVFDSMLNKKVFLTLPVISADLGGGATFASVLAQLQSHVKAKNSLTGRMETMGGIGGSGNFAAHKAFAASLNDKDIFYVCQGIKDLDINANIIDYAAWGKACAVAQTMLGGAIAENISNTKMPYSDLIDPTDFDNTIPGNRKEASKAGILIAYKDENNIIKINIGITSKIDSENNANIKLETRESLLGFAYDIRQHLKAFVGKTRRAPNYIHGEPLSESRVIGAMDEYSIEAMAQGQILAFVKSSISAKFVGNLIYPKIQVQPIEGTDFIYLVIDAVRLV